eukprot:4430979-Pyramimonas_sp.AAC.1
MHNAGSRAWGEPMSMVLASRPWLSAGSALRLSRTRIRKCPRFLPERPMPTCESPGVRRCCAPAASARRGGFLSYPRQAAREQSPSIISSRSGLLEPKAGSGDDEGDVATLAHMLVTEGQLKGLAKLT